MACLQQAPLIARRSGCDGCCLLSIPMVGCVAVGGDVKPGGTSWVMNKISTTESSSGAGDSSMLTSMPSKILSGYQSIVLAS